MTSLVLGANGFIGSAVVRQLASINDNRLFGLVRANFPKIPVRGVQYLHGDVTDYSRMLRVMAGVETVICCVSFVGKDEGRCIEVNDRGMRTVARAVSDSSVERFVYVSTAAVYGTGPFRDLPVGGAPLNPQSAASRTRAAGEEYVRQVGGLVVRPHMVYGPGDKWFVPGLVDTIDRLGCVIDGGSALLSTIHVDNLAHSIANLAVERPFRHDTTVHVNDHVPSQVADILSGISARSGWSLPSVSFSRQAALQRAQQIGLDRRRFDLISLDHWFRNTIAPGK